MYQPVESHSKTAWPNPGKKICQTLGMLILALSLGSCATLGIDRPAAGQAAAQTQVNQMSAPPEDSHTSTPVPIETHEEPAATEAADVIAPDLAGNLEEGAPVRFVFPTPGPAPVSAWRPPLYEVPWALTPYDHFYFHRPISADEVNWPLADYRYGGKFFENVVHTGVDIPAREGALVRAAGPGKVVKAGYGVYSGLNNPDDPYGLAVVIRHDFGYQGEPLYTVYGHLSQIDVAEGQQLQTGDMVGRVGQTGFTTGPHLHFEVRVGENRFFTTRNPELWVAPPVGWGVLAGRVMDRFGRPVYGLPVFVRHIETGQTWQVITYHSELAKSDPYYRENVVMGDLPAGRYEIRIAFFGILYEYPIEIRPGLVNYFTFWGRAGYGDPGLPTPEAEFEPQPIN